MIKPIGLSRGELFDRFQTDYWVISKFEGDGNSNFSIGAFDFVKVVRMEGEIRNIYKIVIGKCETKVPVGSLRHK
jgi:hypothetical protein